MFQFPRPKHCRTLLFFSCLVLGFPSYARSIESGPIPLEDFFRPPVLSHAKISPDGRKLAALIAEKNETGHLLLMDLDSRKVTVLHCAETYKIDSFDWLSERSITYRAVREGFFDIGRFIADFDHLDRRIVVAAPYGHVIGTPIARPGRMLVWGMGEGVVELDKTSIVKERASVIGGEIKPAKRYYPDPPKGIGFSYACDAAGELAIGYAYEDHHFQVSMFDGAKDTWSKLAIDPEKTDILLVEPDRQHLWLNEPAPGGGYMIQRIDLATGQRSEPAARDATYDFEESRVYFSPKDGKVAGISYDRQRRRNVWLLPRFAEIQATVDGMLPDTDNVLVNFDRDERHFLFIAYSDRQPGAYYLLEPDKGTLTPTGQARPWLKADKLRPSRPMAFPTRDGIQLEGYLTLPEAATAEHKVPLVVLCHGGPWSRDTWGFDEEVQFLASRGYAVFQPNYRGSTGYSAEISLEHKFDFRRMHDDVTDATRELKKLVMIDADRVAIMGTSFGGYLAVAGVAYEPGLYRCAVTNCGVFDWERMVKDARSEDWTGKYALFSDRLGKPGKDKEVFDRMSPLVSTKDIACPVFIAHSITDEVVDENQSRRLAAELRRNKIPHETFFRRDEGHGFTTFKTRVEYYRAVEQFLARNLAEPARTAP